MKSLKTTSLILASVVAASLACAQSASAVSGAKPADGASVQSDANKDRSYVEDYADKKPTIVMVDASAGRETPVTLISASEKDFKFKDSSGGELTVPKKSKSFKFAVKTDSNWGRARNAYAAGNWDEAIVYLRPMVYPLLQLTPFDEEACKVHGFVEMYISCLLNANRLIEAKALVLAMPIPEIPPSLLSSVISVADALAKSGDVKGALAITDKISFDADTMSAMEDMMGLLATLRKCGATKECAVWYTKLGNMEGNPFKSECVLWMVYCDMQLGNKMSAEVYLSSMKVERSEEAFSLLQMIKGMLKATAEKPNFGEALDLYAEGIVFGNLSSPWMPELLFNAGIAYKKLSKFVAANEIFLQIAALYPDDPLAARGMKEIVKVEKKPKKVVDEDDEDYDDEDYDDEDYEDEE